MKLNDETTFWGRVKARLYATGMSLTRLCELIGEPYTTMTNRITANRIPKKKGVVEAMARVLGCSVEYLTSGAENQSGFNLGPDIQQLISDYQFLDERKQKIIRTNMEAIVMLQEAENNQYIKEHPEEFS